MKIVRTFVPGLETFKYSVNKPDELTRLFRLWQNPIELEEFFEANKAYLAMTFWKNISVENAILKTIKEAKDLENILKGLSIKGRVKIVNSLNDLFENLDDRQFKIIPLTKSKSKKHWLRLYAIRIDDNKFVITGGAIKLTHKMEEHELTKKELKKLFKCASFLQENNVYNYESFEDLYNETNN